MAVEISFQGVSDEMPDGLPIEMKTAVRMIEAASIMFDAINWPVPLITIMIDTSGVHPTQYVASNWKHVGGRRDDMKRQAETLIRNYNATDADPLKG